MYFKYLLFAEKVSTGFTPSVKFRLDLALLWQ